MIVYLKKKNIIYRDDYFNKYYKDGKMDKNAPLVINIDGLLVKVKDLPDLALNNKNEVLEYCYGVKKMIPEYVPYITFVWEKKMCKVSIEVWNKYVDKNNNEINAEAKDGDIVLKHNGLLFLLQTKNGYNNVIIFRKDEDSTDTRLSILQIIQTLYKDYNIHYIRVEGRNNRYNFFYRTFKDYFVKDFDIKDRDVFYINLKEAINSVIKKINKMKETDFYHQQSIYNKTKSKDAWDKMYFYINDAVESSIKKKLNGVKRKDVDDLVVDATLYIMKRYDKNPAYHIDYLLTAAHYASLYILYNKKQKMLDKELSLETYYANYYLTNNEKEL